jgi:hypothetical protein
MPNFLINNHLICIINPKKKYKNKIMRKLFTFLLVAFASSSFAQTYLMDNFGNTNDTLAAVTANNGWAQIGTTATNPIRSNSTALTYTGYVASGLGNAVNLTTSGQDIVKDITLSSGLNTGQIFVSFMANISDAQATGDYFLALLPPANTSNYMARTYAVLSSPGYYKVAINRWTEARAFSADSFPLNQTRLFVIRYVFNTTTSNTDDSVYMYVLNGGVPATMPATPTAFCSNATSNMTGPIVGRVALRQGTSTIAPTMKIGGLRFATNWGDGPLPVVFSNFDAKLIDGNTHLNWSTSSETNNQGFAIERSINGENFEEIGFVKGAGNSSRLLNYNFIDVNVASPINYYRLKQSDFDGKFEYSETISVVADDAQVNVTPNPFVETIRVSASNQEQVIFAEIIDVTGKVKATSSGMGNLILDTKELNHGVYFIRVNHGEKVIVKRIIKN